MVLPPLKIVQPHQGELSLPNNQMRLDIEEGIPGFIKHRLKNELGFLGLDLLHPEVTSQTIPALRGWLDPDCLPEHQEGYRIEISPGGITLSSSTVQGLGYACTTLRHLLARQNFSKQTITLQPQIIEDWPRFEWRGMHLDVSRHFFPVSTIKRYLDILALHKVNRFHWHLTDDQGWRLEIPNLPRLTEISAWRTEANGSRHGGFYTAEDVKEVLIHAQHLGIVVVPEIEMPGHVRALLAAYPDLCCTEEAQPVPSTWGVFDDVLCVGREETFRVMRTILDYVCELFPGKYVHFGGDEVPLKRWESCPHCQRTVIEEYLLGTASLQGWFTTRIAAYLAEKGKVAIGWDEILGGEPPKETAIMAWRSEEHGTLAAKAGHPVIMSPGKYCYFDHSQGGDGEPEAFPAVLPLERVLQFNPMPPKLDKDIHNSILGGQANLWTERISTPEHLEYMLLPRLCALASNLWIGKPDEETVRAQLPSHMELLSRLGYNYRALEHD